MSLGFDFGLLDLSPLEVIMKFKADIESEVGHPVERFTVSHKKGSNMIIIDTGTEKRVFKSRIMGFLISKGLRMKFKASADFESVELMHGPDKNFIVFKGKDGIETKEL